MQFQYFLSRQCKQLFRLILAVLLATVPIVGKADAEWSGTVALASQYIYRGQDLSDGNPALQGNIDYAHDSGFFAGAWASTIDMANPGGRRDSEFDFYVGYNYAPDAPLDASLSLVRYTYPGQSGPRNYDFTEALLTATLHDRYSLEFGFSNSVYGWGANGRHLELRSDWPLKNAWVVSAGVGYNDIEAIGTSNYLYWDLGASARYSQFIADIRWYDNETPRGILSGLSAESQLVVTLSVAF